MSLITLIATLIGKFGDWIEGLFSASEKLYDKLTEEEKKAANWAYGVIALVNKYGDQALPYIQVAYPDLSEDQLHGFLDTLLNKVKAVDGEVPLTLEEALKSLADYLGRLDGSAWEQISQALGNLLATLFSPETPVQKFINIAEYVYSLFVKPHTQSVALPKVTTLSDSGDGGGLPPDPTHPKPPKGIN